MDIILEALCHVDEVLHELSQSFFLWVAVRTLYAVKWLSCQTQDRAPVWMQSLRAQIAFLLLALFRWAWDNLDPWITARIRWALRSQIETET
jgi:hypothetical protein